MRMKLSRLASVLGMALLVTFSTHAWAGSVLAPAYNDRVSADTTNTAGAPTIPKMKLQFGVDGVYTDVSNSNPLPTVSSGGGGSTPNTAGTPQNFAVTTTAHTFTAPANATGFILESESGNTANVRYAVGATATSSVGTLIEPGRDTGYIPVGANISVIAISGTQTVDVQWVQTN